MKIITLHKSDESLIKKALKNDTNAEREIYNRYAPKMLSVCRSYIKDMHYAEDVMIEGFTKALDNLNKFRFEGSFEGWLKRIMVREAISFLRSRKQLYFSEIEEAEGFPSETPDEEYDIELLQLLIDSLPNGYKTVLIMFTIEGYNHKEIADMLNITESTSKSQLFKARKMLQELLATLNRKRNEKI